MEFRRNGIQNKRPAWARSRRAAKRSAFAEQIKRRTVIPKWSFEETELRNYYSGFEGFGFFGGYLGVGDDDDGVTY